MQIMKKLDPCYQRRLILSFLVSFVLIVLLSVMIPRHISQLKPLLLDEQIPLIAETVEWIVPALPPAGMQGVAEAIAQPVPSVTADPEATIPETVDAQAGSRDAYGAGAGIAGGLFATAPVDTLPPRPVLQVMAEYPQEERKRKVRGIIRLQILVNELGRIEEVHVLADETGSAGCRTAAIEAARQSLFQPAMAGDKPIKCWTICEFGFEPE